MKKGIEKLLIFDIMGPFAHFRKYYTNASSLSYGIPPRTVIAGIIAGILGIERDNYYDIFAVHNTKIAVSLRSGFRRMMQKINYYNIEMKNKSLRYQVPVEILVPQDKDGEVKYRIYFYNETYLDSLYQRLRDKRYFFNPYLGLSEFLADIDLVDYTGEGGSRTSIEPVIPGEHEIPVSTCFKKNCVKEFKFKNTGETDLQYMVERMPVNFKNTPRLTKNGKPKFDKNGKAEIERRELHLFDNFIYETNLNPVTAIFKPTVEIYHIDYKGNEEPENIIFLESWT